MSTWGRNHQARYAVNVRSKPPELIEAHSLGQAEQIAKRFSKRKDLGHEDVRIERRDGTLIRHAGPVPGEPLPRLAARFKL